MISITTYYKVPIWSVSRTDGHDRHFEIETLEITLKNQSVDNPVRPSIDDPEDTDPGTFVESPVRFLFGLRFFCKNLVFLIRALN
ncbi:hypothetical protein Syun_024759 [Stephania yunnanensis]|uniref:Uncharacterized protein n=1 Tax=Stephania yunnanensis TaxID=152371 RepID=A0AAP0EQU2_9MAGN